jgi:hypothetical protein
MPGKIIIDINRRTASKAGLLWNRLTPTRDAKAVSQALADRCSTRDLKLAPEENLFGHYARGLETAGVTEILIEKGTTAGEIRKSLNLLTDRGFRAAARLLPRYGFAPESPNFAYNWTDLRRDLATVDYRDANYFNGGRIFLSGFIGLWLGAGLLTELEPKVLRLIGALIGAVLPPAVTISYQLSKHLYRAARFSGDCRLLVDLSHGSRTGETKRLRNILRRPASDKTSALTRCFPPEVLSKLAQARYLEVRVAAAENPNTPEEVLGRLINEDPNNWVKESVRNNPVVVALLRRAADLTDPGELAELVQKPFPCVWRAVAKNPNAPWDTVALLLSRLQKDPVRDVIGTEIETTHKYCDVFSHKTVPVFGTVGYEYFSKSIEIAEETLNIHHAGRERIMERLKELNPELHAALEKNKTEISSVS